MRKGHAGETSFPPANHSIEGSKGLDPLLLTHPRVGCARIPLKRDRGKEDWDGCRDVHALVGVTADQYDTAMSRLELDSNPAAGSVLHVAAPTRGGP